MMSTQSPFERIGGSKAIGAIVNAFYDLVETDPRFAELRGMHAPDLAPMRRSLAGFLDGWMGGPRHWFDENPGKCMMSLHGKLAIGRDTAGQWVEAMRGALEICQPDPDLAAALITAFENMANGMARNRPNPPGP